MRTLRHDKAEKHVDSDRIGSTCMRRKLKAYGEKERGGHYILDDYEFSHNHTKAVTIRRWRRHLKQHARRAANKVCREYLLSH